MSMIFIGISVIIQSTKTSGNSDRTSHRSNSMEEALPVSLHPLIFLFFKHFFNASKEHCLQISRLRFLNGFDTICTRNKCYLRRICPSKFGQSVFESTLLDSTTDYRIIRLENHRFILHNRINCIRVAFNSNRALSANSTIVVSCQQTGRL